MIRIHHPAEELFELRARIRALKAREAELRAFFLNAARPADRRGLAHEVTVVRQRRRVFVRERLPREVLNDPVYWELRHSSVVKLITRAPEPCHAGLCEPPASDFLPADDPLLEPFD